MVDQFAIGLTHALLALAVWRLLQRSDLDSDDPGKPVRRKWQRQAPEEPAEPAGDA